MNDQTYQGLRETSISDVLPDLKDEQRAANAVAGRLQELVRKGEVLHLTDEEERLLRSFRKFKAGAIKAGAVFKWQTHPESGIVVTDGGLITDPAEAISEVRR